MNNDRFFAGTRKGLFRFERANGSWKQTGQSFLGVAVPMMLVDPRDGTVYAAIEHGHFGIKLQRSEDGGTSWEELDPPAYPAKPDDVPETLCPIRQTPIPWSLEKIWALETGGSEEPGQLWCGTIPGGLFRSRDRGESWEMIRSLWDRPERSSWAGGGYDYPGIHSICLHPDNPKDVAVAISCGGVWRSEDGGETWNQTAHGMFYDFGPDEYAGEPDGQDPHRMVRCAGSPDRWWVQHHCGIFQSRDDAKSWQKVEGVEPSGFGFAVAVHPENPDRAWFVPAQKDEMRIPVDGRVVVNRTSDGGKTFEAMSQGLPQENAYDLIYRHALDVDETGERLVMGSTTGSLWVSQDEGESWSPQSHHLPPVYCLRFG